MQSIKANPEQLLKKHPALIHSDFLKVISHVQREKDNWIINTLMVEGISAPFKFRRKKQYKNLGNQRVNMTYYRDTEMIAGFSLEIMQVVRIKIA